MKARSTLGTFAWPALLAIVTIAALVLGLALDGATDALAALGLAVPLVIGLYFAVRR